MPRNGAVSHGLARSGPADSKPNPRKHAQATSNPPADDTRTRTRNQGLCTRLRALRAVCCLQRWQLGGVSLAQRSLSSRVGRARTKPPAPTHSGAQQDRRAACVGWAHVLFGKKGAYRPAALSASPSPPETSSCWNADCAVFASSQVQRTAPPCFSLAFVPQACCLLAGGLLEAACSSSLLPSQNHDLRGRWQC